MVGIGSRKRWWFVLWIALLVLVVSPAPLAAQSGGITLQVQPFFNGHYKYGEWLPLRITVNNTGASVSANVRVEMTQTGAQSAWLVPVDLPTGAQKQITLYVLPTSFAQLARVRVLNGAQELAKENANLTLHQNNDYLIGVIAPRTEPFTPIGGTILEGATPRTIRTLPIGLNDLPERPEGLRTLDAIVLTDVDTSGLSPAQTSSLTTWVRKGGRLILGGGASAARTLAGLPDDLVGGWRTQTNVTELNALDALGTFGESPVRVQGPFVAMLVAGGEALIQEGGNALVVEKRVGDGYVTYSALDLAASPFDAWAGAARFWKKIVMPGSAYPLNTPVDVSPNLIRSRYLALALQNLPVLALPSVNTLAILLAAYIVLVGPINYLVLRRLKKLDWGWLTIPVLTLLFAIGAFGVSTQLRGSDVILNQVSIVNFSTDGSPREMETVVGLFSPTRGSFNLEVPANGLVIPISNQYDVFARGQETTTNVEIVESNPLEVRGIEINQAALQAFAIQSPAPENWRIESDFTIEEGRVRGSIVNRSNVTLSDTTMVSGERYIHLGEIAPNQTREVDQTWQLFGGYIGNLVTGNTSNHEARRQILSARFDSWRGNDRLTTTPILIGWVNTSPLDVRVQNISASRETKTLVVVPLNVKFAQGVFQFGLNDWRVQEVSATGERTNCGMTNYTGVRNGNIVMDFLPPFTLQPHKVKSLKVLVREAYPQTVELQDTSNEWVVIPIKDPTDYVVENPQRFVRPNGAVRMRVSSKEVFDRCVLYGLEMGVEVEK
jgi:hypothetical protein